MWLLAGCVPVVAALVFLNSMHGSFIWDDYDLLVQNTQIRNIRRVLEPFSLEHWRKQHMSAGAIYRPLRSASFALDFHFWRFDPFGYHLTNTLLHAANAAIVFLVLSALLRNPSLAAISAILFALHPVHGEAVIWLKNRSDLFAFAFFMLAVWLFMRAARGDGVRHGLFALALAFFLAAALAKETAIILPLVLTLAALGFSDLRPRLALARTLPFWALAALFVLARLASAHEGTLSSATMPPVHSAVPKTLGSYACLLFFPSHLNADRSFAHDAAWPLGLVLLVALAVVPLITKWCNRPGCTLVAASGRVGFHVSRLKSPSSLVTFGLFWILITLLPVSNLVPLASRPLAEQRLYLPSLGACVALASLAGVRPRRVGLLLALAAVLAAGTLHRNHVWRTSRHLWADAVVKSPANRRALCNLSNAYRGQRNFHQAERLLRRTLAADPTYVEALYRLAQTLHDKGDLSAAQKLYAQILEQDGRFWEAWHGLANVHQAKGDLAQARQTYERLVTLNVDDPVGHCGLGHVFAETGEYEKAKSAYLKAIELNPDYIQARASLADVLETMGDVNGALAQRDAVLYIDPTRPPARVSRGILLAKLGRIEDAMSDFRYALRIDPRNRQAHYNLGLALEKAQRPSEALGHYRQALGISPVQDAKLHCAIGDIHRNQNRVAEAMREYALAITSDPTCQPAFHNLATLHLARHEMDEAVRNYQAALAVAPDSAPAHYGLGIAYREKGILKEARTELEAALKLDPAFAPARQALAELSRQGEKD
ncbi:MAG: tetratricopeptide repeat protein [Planctomycetes bacterium]|nr:tetratricopeptide repeat protein [Planctomycetota bacterium]